MPNRLCVCVRPRQESPEGILRGHSVLVHPDGAVLFFPQVRTETGLSSWDLLWVSPGPAGEAQLQGHLGTSPASEVLITGPCGALQPGMSQGRGLYANEVLDPDCGPHTPIPTRALSRPAVSRALGEAASAGKFLTTAVPCGTPSHKFESGHGYGAIAVDQDSALLCRPCQQANLGHAVVRFVFDPMEEDLSEDGSEATRRRRLEGALAVERNVLRLLAGL